MDGELQKCWRCLSGDAPRTGPRSSLPLGPSLNLFDLRPYEISDFGEDDIDHDSPVISV